MQTLDMLYQSMQAKAVAVGSKAANLPHGYGSNIGMMAKGLTFVNIAEVYFNGGDAYGGDRISNGYAGVGISARIKQDTVFAAEAGLDAVY